MGYAEELLSDGERIIAREKQHWFVFVAGARFTILAVVIAVILAILSSGIQGDGAPGALRTVLNWITVVLFFGGLAVLGWTTLRYLNQEYILTNRRVIQVQGVLNKTTLDSALEKINDAALSQSIFGRMFGFGDLEILTAVGFGDQQVPHDHRPDRLQEGDAQRQARVRHGHGGRVPAGPADPRRGRRDRRRQHGRCDRRDGGPGRRAGDGGTGEPGPRTPTTWPGRSRRSRTCATAARSAPRSTRRRRRTCSDGSSGYHTRDPSRGAVWTRKR